MNLNVFDLLLIITLTGEMYIFAKLNFEDTKRTLTRLLLTKIYLWGHFLHKCTNRDFFMGQKAKFL